MDKIGHLLPAQPRAALWRAAATLDAANQAIKEVIPEIATEAQAKSVKHDTVYIWVSHGAVAGLIKIRQQDIIKKINTAIWRHGSGPSIKKIITRRG